MKKYLLGTVALVAMGFVAPASAADLAARPYTKAPPMMVAIYDWSGFYIGANGGYGTSRKCLDFVVPGAVAGEGCHDEDGATAGGQIGYRWQTGPMVYGIEGQGNWADFRGSRQSALVGAITNRTRTDAFGLFTGQIGYAWNNTLLYVKGGGAVVGQRYDSFFTAGGPGSAGSVSGRDTRFGATVGVGLEYGFTPNWSFGVEYNHIFLGTTTYNYPAPSLASERIRGDIDMVTAKINYKWGGPVVARY